MQSLCNGWEYIPQVTAGFLNGLEEGIFVRLPHTVRELPMHYPDHQSYETLCGYRKSLDVPEALHGKRLFLQFDGAAHIATVYVNGQKAAHHHTGYTAFRVEITNLVRYGEKNLIAVALDTTENPTTPPFGGVIDYLTFGGLYREVWLDVREQDMITDLYITTPTLDTANLVVTAECADDCSLTAEIIDEADTLCLTQKILPGKPAELYVPGAKSWCCETPNRYLCRVTLRRGSQILDVQEVKFGFRTVAFKADGFYLNGEKFFMRGLNRHQCYPYIGYAAPESLQREDARILKEELACNTVRTSHYPQSHHFIDECDRLGLLVFTEIPGWQHVGDEAWQDQAVQNVREMILQYRNHPSIVLWGVRINESLDNDSFYLRTNALAHELDPSRLTSGVRFLSQSSLLEDVYGYNDFSHNGNNPGCRDKALVVPDPNKAILITEHSGHIFPTKAFDNWSRRQEHALRHATVLNAAYESGVHAGCIGWCMFDYVTHKECGSGDRVCYHGVLDAFRNPKLAASTYQIQQDEFPVLTIGSNMDLGDYSTSAIGNVYAFTNADSVKLYKNDVLLGEMSEKAFPALAHSPILLDPLGDQLSKAEGYTGDAEKLLHRIMTATKVYGLDYLPEEYRPLLAEAEEAYGIEWGEIVRLYGKYIGGWGDKSMNWRIDAIKDGQVVSSVTCCPSTDLHMEVRVSKTNLHEGHTYDMAAVRVRLLDAHENPAVYAQLPVFFTLEGAAELVGPEVVTAEGGMCGTYIRTIGAEGSIRLTIHTFQTFPVTIDLTTSVPPNHNRKDW